MSWSSRHGVVYLLGVDDGFDMAKALCDVSFSKTSRMNSTGEKCW